MNVTKPQWKSRIHPEIQVYHEQRELQPMETRPKLNKT